MPLIDLKTDLKSLKYGYDQPGGGSSRQPYQRVDINNTNDFSFGISGVDDGLIRGGQIRATSASVADVFRIGKFLKDLPKGPLWLVKQAGLQKSNPRIETRGFIRPTSGGGFIRNVANAVSNVVSRITSVVGANRIYNPLGTNTLLQVGVNAFGGHLVRHGLLPIQNNEVLYFKTAQFNNQGPEAPNNRLVKLMSIIGDPAANIDEYPGGPSTRYGLGTTLIRRRGDFVNYDQDAISGKYALVNSFIDSKANAGRPLINGERQEFTFISSRTLQPEETDALENFPSAYGGAIINGMGISNRWNRTKYIGSGDISPLSSGEKYSVENSETVFKNIANATTNNASTWNGANSWTPQQTPGGNTGKTVFTSSIGTGSKAISEYLKGESGSFTPAPPLPAYTAYDALKKNIKTTITQITQSTPPGYGKNTIPVPEFFKTKEIFINRGAKDFKYFGSGSQTIGAFFRSDESSASSIDISFSALDPFDGLSFKTLEFKSFLNNYTDSSNSTWNSTKYVGRATKFYIFNEYKRSISLGFTIPCFNEDQTVVYHRDLERLASSLAGVYNNGLLGGVVLKATVGNYIRNEYIIIDSLTFSPLENSSWDTAQQFAHNIKVDMNFTLIHNTELPQYASSFFYYI